MARRKSKKTDVSTAPAGGTDSMPPPAPAPDSTPTAATDAVSAAPAGSDARGAGHAPGTVRTGVCVLGMLGTLILGLYIGSLLPSVTSRHAAPAGQTNTQAGGQAAPPPQAEAQAPARNAAPQAAQDAAPPMPPELARQIDALEKAVLENPKDAARWTQLGNLYFDTGQAPRAIKAYERSLALAPDNPDVLTDLGIMLRETHAFEKAVASFRRASAVSPRHENALFNEGVVLYYDLNRKEEARRAWQNLLRVNPAARAPDGKSIAEMLKQLR